MRRVLRRVALALVVIWGVTLTSFVVSRLLPGNPVYLIVGTRADEQTVQEATAKYGLDRSLPEQYWIYMRDLVRGDLGESWTTSNPVTSDIAQRFPATLELSLVSFILAMTIALPLGIAAALRPGGAADRVASSVSVGGAALPQFWLGLMLIYLFFFRLQWMPPPMGRLPLATPPPTRTGLLLIDTLLAGDLDLFKLAAWTLILPSVTLALAVQAPILSLVRTGMKDALDAPPILTAKAFGLPRRVWLSHAWRLAMLPVLNMVGISFGYLLGGTVLVESVFSWPGMGLYALQAMNASDYAAVQGVVLVSALIYVTVYLVLDIVQLAVDPRARD